MRFGVFCLVFILTFSSLSALAAEGASANGEEPLKGLFDSYKKHSVTVSAEETPASSSGVTEKAIIQRVNEELALLSASIQIAPESIKADLDGRAVICENVTITNPETPGFAVTIEKILVSGVDAASYAGSPGDMTEVENLSFHNIRFSEGGATKATLDKYSIEGFSFAYRDAIKALQEQKNGKADTSAMPSYMSSYKAKLSQASGFKASDDVFRLSIESLTTKDSEFSACGAVSLRNVHVDLQEQRIFSLEEFGLAGMAMPEIFKQMALNPDSNDMDSLQAALMGNPFSVLDKLAVKELFLSNMRIDFPPIMPVALAKLACDLRVENGTASLTGDLRDLSLALSQLQGQSPFSMLSEAANGQDLLLNAAVALAADGDRKMTFSSSINEKQKGDISLKTILTLTQNFDGLLHEAEFKAEDSGIVDVLLGAVATIAGEEGGYAQFLKEAVTNLQQGKGAFTDPGLIDGIDKLTKLIQDGGSFRFALRPDSPLDLNRFGELVGSSPAALGYSFEYAAPAVPKKRQ